jgi:twitching motility protein PilT
VELIDLLRIAAEREASDLHLTVGVPPVLRINGSLVLLSEMPKLQPEEISRLILSSLTDVQRAHFESKWELDFSTGIPGIARFRVNVYRQRGSIGAAIRRIPFVIPHLEDLHLPKAVGGLVKKERGLVLVTGPTGSGKSTTLASMVDIINETRPCHILTIEDPIEYLHKHKRALVNQREVGSDTNSFADALRSALREDPDVILVGEMRDLETMAIALTAAETGHLVFATLHTNSAAQSVDRIIDAFPPYQQGQIRLQVAQTIEGIVSQRLLPVVDGTTRVPAVEIMLANAAIRNMIRDAKTHQIPTAIQMGASVGMQTMDTSLRDLYQKGSISYEEASINVNDLDEFNRYARPELSRVSAPGKRP